MKAGDMHPEENPDVCYSITDKTFGRQTLEAVQVLANKQNCELEKTTWSDI